MTAKNPNDALLELVAHLTTTTNRLVGLHRGPTPPRLVDALPTVEALIETSVRAGDIARLIGIVDADEINTMLRQIVARTPRYAPQAPEAAPEPEESVTEGESEAVNFEYRLALMLPATTVAEHPDGLYGATLDAVMLSHDVPALRERLADAERRCKALKKSRDDLRQELADADVPALRNRLEHAEKTSTKAQAREAALRTELSALKRVERRAGAFSEESLIAARDELTEALSGGEKTLEYVAPGERARRIVRGGKTERVIADAIADPASVLDIITPAGTARIPLTGDEAVDLAAVRAAVDSRVEVVGETIDGLVDRFTIKKATHSQLDDLLLRRDGTDRLRIVAGPAPDRLRGMTAARTCGDCDTFKWAASKTVDCTPHDHTESRDVTATTPACDEIVLPEAAAPVEPARTCGKCTHRADESYMTVGKSSKPLYHCGKGRWPNTGVTDDCDGCDEWAAPEKPAPGIAARKCGNSDLAQRYLDANVKMPQSLFVPHSEPAPAGPDVPEGAMVTVESIEYTYAPVRDEYWWIRDGTLMTPTSSRRGMALTALYHARREVEGLRRWHCVCGYECSGAVCDSCGGDRRRSALRVADLRREVEALRETLTCSCCAQPATDDPQIWCKTCGDNDAATACGTETQETIDTLRARLAEVERERDGFRDEYQLQFDKRVAQDADLATARAEALRATKPQPPALGGEFPFEPQAVSAPYVESVGETETQTIADPLADANADAYIARDK